MGSQIVFRTVLCCLATVGVSAGIASPTMAAPIVTVTEVIDPADVDRPLSSGRYIIEAGDLEGNVIVGFAGDNSVAQFALTNRTGWLADVISATAWDAGYGIFFNGFHGGFPAWSSKTRGSGGIGTFAAFFGPTPNNRANFYRLALDEGVPIVDFEIVADQFFFFPAVADSTLLVFLQQPDGDVFAFVPSSNGGGGGGTVPEPGTLALVLTGLGLRAASRARRRTRPEASRRHADCELQNRRIAEVQK